MGCGRLVECARRRAWMGRGRLVEGAQDGLCVCVHVCGAGRCGPSPLPSLPPPAAGPCGRLPSCIVYVRVGLRRGCHGECAVGVRAGAAGSLLPPSPPPNPRMWCSRVRPAQCRVRSRACASVSLLLTISRTSSSAESTRRARRVRDGGGGGGLDGGGGGDTRAGGDAHPGGGARMPVRWLRVASRRRRHAAMGGGE